MAAWKVESEVNWADGWVVGAETELAVMVEVRVCVIMTAVVREGRSAMSVRGRAERCMARYWDRMRVEDFARKDVDCKIAIAERIGIRKDDQQQTAGNMKTMGWTMKTTREQCTEYETLFLLLLLD